MDTGIFLSSSFGEALKAVRKRSKLTQKQLAQLLGVHHNTISSWELGTYLPATRGLVLELAHHLRLDGQEAQQLLEASLTTLSPRWNIPYQRNSFFTGRDDILRQIHTTLQDEQNRPPIRSCALSGLGGIGKTQTVVEYAYRYAQEYTSIFWIGAETFESIVSSFLEIAEMLLLPERLEADQQRMIGAVQHWLAAHDQWLLIWDNVEDLDLLSRFLPPARRGAILITTRHQALGTLALGIHLLPMTLEEGMLFVLRRAKVLSASASSEQMQHLTKGLLTEYNAAQELATIMDGFPLALDQAGAYIEETGCSFFDYGQRYEQRRSQLLDRRGTPAGDHPRSVVTTLTLAYQRVAQKNPVALELLCCCAFVASDAIPEELFVAGASYLGPELELVASDPHQLNLALAALRSLSLMQRYPKTRTLSLHRLIQVVLRERMSEPTKVMWAKRVIASLNALFPEATHEGWKQCERLLPHVLTCATAIPDQQASQDLVEVLRKAANYLRERAQYNQAGPLYERALHVGEQTLGPLHSQVGRLLNNLALLYFEQGKYERAEPLYERALHIWEQTKGPQHPNVAHTLHNLAFLYFKQGKHERAEPLYLRALGIWKQALGSEHPNVAHTLNNLANIYAVQGKYSQAEPLFQQALHIFEQALGPEHPDVAFPLDSLGTLYREQGKYEQAEPLYQRTLHIREQELGPEHALMASPLTGLGTLYREQGKYEQAEPLYQRALHIREQALGPQHLDVAQTLTALATLYREQGKYEQAEPLYQRALSSQTRHLGDYHSEIAQTLYDLAVSRQKQGNLSEASSFAEHALKICLQSLGDTHPKTVVTQTLYDQLVST